jgi:protein-tyrosine phosphatase
MGVVDLHAHVLHGLDDGPASLEQSLAMLRMAASAGTEEIVATPHFSRKHPWRPALVQRRWEELQHLAGDAICVRKGCEVELAPEAVSRVLAAPQGFTLAGTRYLLVEIPDDLHPDQAEPLLGELQAAGLRVILAHPEMHPALVRERRRIRRWVEQGILVQANASSFLGLSGAAAGRSANRWLKQGLVHFIASNGHDLQYRPPRLDAAHLVLAGDYPVELLDRIFERHPQAVLRNEPLPAGPVEVRGLGRRWWPF